MKISSLNVRNYRSLKDLNIRFPESGMLVLVGANNAGKSNVIRAIEAICGEQWFGKDNKLEDHDFYLRNRGNDIQIAISFNNGNRVSWASVSNQWPKYTDRHGNTIYDQKIKDAFPCVYLGADRTFDKHLSFYDWTLIGKIRKAFHKQAKPVESKLEDKFGELVQIFDEIQGFSQFKSDFARFFSEMQADTSAKLKIDFQPYTPANYFKTMQLVAADPSGCKMDLDELGEGSRNVALLALLRSYALNLRASGEELCGILALEEPEIYMHPQARRHLFKILREISDSGMQVVISTHSSSFIDTENFDSIGRVVRIEDEENPGCFHTQVKMVSKKDLVAHCEATGVPKGKSTVENIGEFYKTTSNAILNEAFFARFLIIVEGETEELALPVYLAAQGYDCDLLGISIVSVRGKNQIPKYWRLFGKFDIPILVIADNDDDETNSKRKTNTNIATSFGLQLDDFFQDVSICKQMVCKRKPDTPILILEKDFENSIRKDFQIWNQGDASPLDQWENEAKALIKPLQDQNKGQIARFIARKICKDNPEFKPAIAVEIINVLDYYGIRPKVSTQPATMTQSVEISFEDSDEIPF